MTLVVARLLEKTLFLVSDTRVSLEYDVSERYSLLTGMTKLYLFTRYCCVGIAGNVKLADGILGYYRRSVLPEIIAKPSPLTRMSKPKPEFKKRTLEYFRDCQRTQNSAEDSVEFVLAFAGDNPSLYELRSTSSQAEPVKSVWLGDHIAFSMYQKNRFTIQTKVANGSSSGVGAASVFREGEPHAVDAHLSRPDKMGTLVTSMGKVLEQATNTTAGGHVVAVYLYDGEFYYHSYASLSRSGRDIGGAWGYAVLSVLNDESKLALFLATRETSSTRTILLYGPYSGTALGPQAISTGGVMTQGFKVSTDDESMDFAEALYHRVGIEVELPFVSVRDNTNAIGYGMHSKGMQLIQQGQHYRRTALNSMSGHSSIDSTQRKASRVSIKVMRRAVRISGRARLMIKWIGEMYLERALRSTQRDEYRNAVVGREYLRQWCELEPRDLAGKLSYGMATLKAGRTHCIESQQQAYCDEAVDVLATCCANGVMTRASATMWADVLQLASPELYGRERMLRHLNLAIRTFANPTRGIQVDRLMSAWLEAGLSIRRSDISGVPIVARKLKKYCVAISRFLLQAPDNILANYLLGRCLLSLAAICNGRVRQRVLIESALPYLRVAGKASPREAAVLVYLANALVTLEQIEGTTTGSQYEREAQSVLQALSQLAPNSSHVKMLLQVHSDLLRRRAMHQHEQD